MTQKIKRSPLFYVGDKYKLMKQLLNFFPKEINNFFEPFVGGGTVFLNVKAEKYYVNDIDRHLVNIHKLLLSSSKDPKTFFKNAPQSCPFFISLDCFKNLQVPECLHIQLHRVLRRVADNFGNMG